MVSTMFLQKENVMKIAIIIMRMVDASITGFSSTVGSLSGTVAGYVTLMVLALLVMVQIQL